MKKFLTIFCSVLALSSTSVYARTLNPTPINLKNKTSINLNIPSQNQKYNCANLKKRCTCKNNTTSCTTTTATTTQITTKPSSKPTTEATTETTTQTISKPTTETVTKPSIKPPAETTTSTTVNNNAQANMAQEVLKLVNAERAKQKLPPLKLNTALSNVAQLKSEDMKNKNYFDHTSPTYGSPFNMMKQFGINYKYAGENIAKGQKTAADVVTAWMNSEGHRANILNKNFTDMGLGYVKSGSTTYWTQMFIQ
ncbi:MAG: serine protease [Clostridiales bacterium]|nr:serine protease [Clostridiales bacterium]